jgi:hypothetical protein
MRLLVQEETNNEVDQAAPDVLSMRRCSRRLAIAQQKEKHLSKAVTKTDLSTPRTRLIELMQELNYGRIEGLEIRDGEPQLDPPPIAVRLFMFGKTNGPNESRKRDDFVLKRKLIELFEIFDRERSLSIQELMIDNGLPVRMTVAGRVRV